MMKQFQLRVDPIVCTGHGICAELLPELIRLDDWGYPIIDRDPLDPLLMAGVRRAIAACPALALRVESAHVGSSVPERGARRRVLRRHERGPDRPHDGGGRPHMDAVGDDRPE